MITTKVINNITEIKEEWNKLLQNSDTATVFQTPEYIEAWCESFVKDAKEIAIMAVFEGVPAFAKSDLVSVFTKISADKSAGKEGKELIGIAPLRRVGDKITFLGTDKIGEKGDLVTDFGDIVCQKGKEKEVWENVLQALKELGVQIIELDYLREYSLSFKILSEKHQSTQMMDIQTPDVAPFIDLPKTFEEYLAFLNRKDRHELKRKLRRLEGMGYEIIISQNPTKDIEEFIRLHKVSTEDKDKFMTEEMATFFRRITEKLLVKNCIEIVFMLINGVKVSSTFSFLCHNEYWLYNSGFDRNFEYNAVGLLLKALTIKMAIEKGLTKYNFLRGNERYKYDLGAKDERLYRITVEL